MPDTEEGQKRMRDAVEPQDRAGERSRSILVEIGGGELIDKITILQIKAERMSDPDKLANVRVELAVLEAARQAQLPSNAALAHLEAELRHVNARLWEVEDEIRDCEARGEFGPAFVALARSVYKTNDRRADLKKRINLATGARVIEEKSYGGRDAAAEDGSAPR